ncbi:MAG TPA: YggT family protein [Dokdonella sp.]|uniref:YggT family protein n=1 Tax=Dokdonella sp. TaxID=2291710 RepID=UPI0025BE9BF1|nr:YggT family protein [Dokdonella sp.]MBX3690881.1 YggT family protein [Dokdonella sp.]HNR91397.1 YggT family protein [Dokdonella sp.]
MSYFANAGIILVGFAFGIAIGLIMLRVLLQLVRANFHNPICQFLYKATNPVLMPLRKLIPGWRRLDVAGVLLAYMLFVVEHAVISALLGRLPALPGLLVGALANLIGWLLVLIGVLIFVRAILSFVGSDSRHPVVPLLIQLTEPVLAPIRRRLPNLGGLDFSPMLAILAILLLRALVVQPIADLGARLS